MKALLIVIGLFLLFWWLANRIIDHLFGIDEIRLWEEEAPLVIDVRVEWDEPAETTDYPEGDKDDRHH